MSVIETIRSLSPLPCTFIYGVFPFRFRLDRLRSKSSDILIALSYIRIMIVLSRVPIFVVGGADNNAAKSSGFMISLIFPGSLIKGTFDAVSAADCKEISQSDAYHRYALRAASLLLQVASDRPEAFI